MSIDHQYNSVLQSWQAVRSLSGLVLLPFILLAFLQLFEPSLFASNARQDSPAVASAQASSNATRSSATDTSWQEEEAEYFPAQFVNQGKEFEELPPQF